MIKDEFRAQSLLLIKYPEAMYKIRESINHGSMFYLSPAVQMQIFAGYR